MTILAWILTAMSVGWCLGALCIFAGIVWPMSAELEHATEQSDSDRAALRDHLRRQNG